MELRVKLSDTSDLCCFGLVHKLTVHSGDITECKYASTASMLCMHASNPSNGVSNCYVCLISSCSRNGKGEVLPVSR